MQLVKMVYLLAAHGLSVFHICQCFVDIVFMLPRLYTHRNTRHALGYETLAILFVQVVALYTIRQYI